MVRIPVSSPKQSAAVPRLQIPGLRPFAAGAFALLCLLFLCQWVWNARQANTRDMPIELGPVVVAMQKIGHLHTASFTMKDVVHQETQTEPEGPLASLPGASSVVHWATRNQALVVVEGTVEAGVDLSRLAEKDITQTKRADGTTAIRVHLPPITLYPPRVQARVERNEAGMLWRDENIVPKAQEKASRQFLEAAEKQGIRQQAQDNAIHTLQTMQHTLGHDVEFYF